MSGALHANALLIAQAAQACMRSPQWLRAIDDDHERVWLMVEAVCDVLHRHGIRGIPSQAELRHEIDRAARDMAIIQGFDGRNYDALASKHHITTRQVRRILGRGRTASAEPREKMTRPGKSGPARSL